MSPGKKQLPPPGGADPLREALTQRLARPEEPPAAPPAPEPAVAPLVTTPPVPDMDEGTQARWRQSLNAYALRTVAARRRADAAVLEWDRLCADAADAGVPVGLVAAACDAADPQRQILARPPA